jgi:UrcA family protein
MKGRSTIAANFAALAVVAATAVPAFAQPQSSEQVIVPSPYAVSKTNVGRTRTATFTMSQVVPTGDLDLGTAQGMTALEGRVKQAAAGVCREMDRRYPLPAYTPETVNMNCTGTAVRQAMAQAQGAGPAPQAVAQATAPKQVALAQATTVPPPVE